MLTYLLVRLADAYSMIIFIYVMMSWRRTPKAASSATSTALWASCATRI